MSSNTTVAQSVPPDMFRPADVVLEFFPDVDDNEVTRILWEHTGYPDFFSPADGETVEDCLRKQVQAYKARPKRCRALPRHHLTQTISGRFQQVNNICY